jgi:hypothetical protein
VRKILVTLLAVMFVLSAASVGFAAPFSDVPRDHWAYKAVNDLAKGGLIDGYGDGNFRGDKTMTRYEMAMIVANALTKEDKANAEQKKLIEKLAKEFSAELDKLDARLTKVEDKTRITVSAWQQFFVGNSTANPNVDNAGYSGLAGKPITDKTHVGERLRLFFSAADADNNFLLNARLYQARSNWQRTGAESVAGTSTAITADRYWVTVKDFAGGSLDLGKQLLWVGKGVWVYWSGYADGACYSFKSNNVTTRVGEGNLSGYGGTGEYTFGQVMYKPSKDWDLGAYYYKNVTQLTQLYGVAGSFNVGNGMGIMFDAVRNSFRNINTTGYYVGLISKVTACDIVPQNAFHLVDPKVLHDAGWGLSYRHMPDGVAGTGNIAAAGSFTTPLTDPAGTTVNTFENVNVFGADYYYVPLKNLIWTLEFNHVKPIAANANWKNNYVLSTLSFFF